MHEQVAWQLAALYDAPFGGKQLGRFRISLKLMRELSGRRRLYEDDVERIRRELFELGYILIDMESYFAVLSHRTLSSYRRVNEDQVSPRDVRVSERSNVDEEEAGEE